MDPDDRGKEDISLNGESRRGVTSKLDNGEESKMEINGREDDVQKRCAGLVKVKEEENSQDVKHEGSDCNVKASGSQAMGLDASETERSNRPGRPRKMRGAPIPEKISNQEREEPTLDSMIEATKANPLDNNSIEYNGVRIPKYYYEEECHKVQIIEKETKLDDFLIGKYLGSGKFGVINMVKHRATGCIFALKTLWKHKLRKYNQEPQVKREIGIHLRLLHRNILRMYTWFEDEQRVFLVLEYAPGGELYHILNSQGRFSELRAGWYISQIVEALGYIHHRNVLHRDLKPENILVGLDDELKLADFGWSALQHNSTPRNTFCGTLDYLPPEMVNKQSHDHRCDLWALGILAFEFLEGRAPFEHECTQETYKNIKTANPIFKKDLTPEARSFVMGLLAKDPKNRLKMNDVKRHPFVQMAMAHRRHCEQRYGGRFALLQEHTGTHMANVKLPKNTQYAQQDGDYKEEYGEDTVETIKKKVKTLPLERF